MLPIEAVQEMLDSIAQEFPPEFFKDLNGGIMLLPEAKTAYPRGKNALYTLGEYHRDRLGRYIVIYYGSFERVHGALPPEKLKERLRETLRHEFTHHWESLAGERDLEIEDARRLRQYLEKSPE